MGGEGRLPPPLKIKSGYALDFSRCRIVISPQGSLKIPPRNSEPNEEIPAIPVLRIISLSIVLVSFYRVIYVYFGLTNFHCYSFGIIVILHEIILLLIAIFNGVGTNFGVG